MVNSKDSYAGLILYSLRTTLYLLGTAVRHSLLRFSLRQSEELGCGLADEWAGGQAGRQGSRETFKQMDECSKHVIEAPRHSAERHSVE